MKASSELKTRSDYDRIVRPHLPPHAFAPDARHLWRIVAHLSIAFAGYVVLRSANSWWVMLAVSVLLGHSMACLLFLAHDVSHSSVLANRAAKRGLELLLWGLRVNEIPKEIVL